MLKPLNLLDEIVRNLVKLFNIEITCGFLDLYGVSIYPTNYF